MSYETIEFAIDDGYAAITLNRPSALNAFTEQMHSELAAALQEVETTAGIGALLLTGAGRGFCAGQDLSDRRTAVDLSDTIDRFYNPLICRLRALPMPVVCAVNGVAAGAGANIALACDIVLAARSARFIQAFCKIGLIPDSGGTWTLPRLVGHARAAALALTGDPLGAEDAVAWGMIYRAVDDADLLDEAHAMCAHFATQPTLGLAGIKQALQAGWNNDFETQIELERQMQGRLGRTEDYREGVTAFFEKRKPVFRGR